MIYGMEPSTMANIELGFSQFYTIDTTRVNYRANHQNKTYLPSKAAIGVAKWVCEEPSTRKALDQREYTKSNWSWEVWSGFWKYQTLMAMVPERIPGNTLFPNMRTAATIIPEGAHMGEAWELSMERVSDNCPVPTYIHAIMKFTRNHLVDNHFRSFMFFFNTYEASHHIPFLPFLFLLLFICFPFLFSFSFFFDQYFLYIKTYKILMLQ